MAILVKVSADSPGSRWERMEDAAYASEAELQELLQTGSAELIPPDPSSDESHVVYARELSTAAGPIDLVGIGSSGSITIMECKLARNRQIKREVVGQVLDYASAISEMDLPSFVAAFQRAAGTDPFQALRAGTSEEGGALDEEACRLEVARRLEDGEFRLLIAVDAIDADLRRIIQYVNRLAGRGRGLKLVALEFQRYRSGSIEVLVPETYGDEPSAGAPSAREMTGVQLLHIDFWTAFQARLAEQASALAFGKPPASSILNSRTTPDGFSIQAWNRMNDGLSGVSLVAKTPAARGHLAGLDWDAVAADLASLGEPVQDLAADPPWISVRRDGRREGMPTEREQWPALMAWMESAVHRLSTISHGTSGD